MAVVALAGVIGVLWKPMSDRVERLEVLLDAHVAKDDHPIAQTAEIAQARKDLASLDAKLKRERELVEEALRVSTSSVRREIAELNARLAAEIAHVRELELLRNKEEAP
jgi:hypothetical protein